MAELIWTDPALSDLDRIADYIAIDNPEAAQALVKRVFAHVEQVIENPESGSIVRELRSLRAYRQIVEPPCRVLYRIADEGKIYIVHVMRGEQLLRRKKLTRGS
ncbi:MAG: type II toxin-antitoxin system RelE/ParE family toxin [Verrucomicrobia bacterium]|nr:type II toxin-antitoxin system RelE/ParE family toxin [Verrucomicrobiota bacterium]